MAGRMVTATARLIAPAGIEHADRHRWLTLRREGIGGSDIAPIMGLAEFGRTAWQVFLDKTGVTPLDDHGDWDERAEEAAWFGHEMEFVAAKRFRMHYPGTRTARCGMLARADAPWMRVNLDRRVTGCPLGSPCLWECKNRGFYASRDWDRDGDAEAVPDGPAFQTHWGLMVTGYGHGHLSVVIGGNELRSYVIRADPGLHRTLRAEADWFWHDCVVRHNPPPVDEAERTGRILARLWDADPDKVLTAPPDIVDLWQRLRAAAAAENDAAGDAARLRHELQAWMGDAEVLLGPDGSKLATWKQNSTFRDGEFRAAEPGLAAEYTRTVEVTDTKRLDEDKPDIYRAWRARQFRVYDPPKPRKPRTTPAAAAATTGGT